ncbi:thioredoxin domain-containing protein 11 isoform X2 [Rhinatrema bivittatum]|uniref:thioredoxin domain-containing protein 11 isoform X2 n=1 Tax=Rhinatrema bivittatum TaxID=194408 RepID=UPI001129E155|nr:thioredoxin domain-containing protein 11 isoform X2 [Rhinatrema bivittatum]
MQRLRCPPSKHCLSQMGRRPELLCGAIALSCAFIVALRVTCGRAKDVIVPAKPPVNFFSPRSPVIDLFRGQLDYAEHIRQDSEITLFFLYAPWCGQSIATREEIERVASRLADQVLFVAVNCWWNQGKCRKQKSLFYFPVIYLYHKSFGPIEYKGPMTAAYIEKFVRRVMTPLLYIPSRSRLRDFLANYEPAVLGYFEFNASPQPPGYLTFFSSALHSLKKDYIGTVRFGVITDRRIAKEISLMDSGSVYLHRKLNASLITEMAFQYKSCNESQAIEPGLQYLRQTHPSTLEPLVSHCPLHTSETLKKYQCCNTVVLPQWHTISRTHNVCDLCINQTVGMKPSQVKVPQCNFFEIEAALDSFYLKEHFFMQIMSHSIECSNFLSFYSPFRHYTACCRTMRRGLIDLTSSEQTNSQAENFAFASHGKNHEDWSQLPVPHIEASSPVLPGLQDNSKNITGLSCKTNKTLNLYLLDSNLFWRYAERLGALKTTPVKEFATIVDLKEEIHYVLDQNQALVKPTLETFIQNFSTVYSPLKRQLVSSSPAHGPKHSLITEVTTSTFQQVVMTSQKDVLLQYYAPWCGFCATLNHLFIRLARLLPSASFIVARINVARNDLPWEFMVDRLPTILFFPHGRKDFSVKYPEDLQINLPNLLKFILQYSSQPPSLPELCPKESAQGQPTLPDHASHLADKIRRLQAEINSLRKAQTQLASQISEARKDEKRLKIQKQTLEENNKALQLHKDLLQALYEEKAKEVGEMAEKLQELMDTSKSLLRENALLKILISSMEEKLIANKQETNKVTASDQTPSAGPGPAVLELEVEAHNENRWDISDADSTVTSEYMKENRTD